MDWAKRIVAGLGFALVAAGAPGTVYAEAGDFQMRLRGLIVQPSEDASITPIGGDIEVNLNNVPELDFTYFFTKHIAAELILATTRHEVGATGTTLGNLDLGEVWLLPPTLTLQYHFSPDKKIRPYVGAGINYTIFYNDNEPAGFSIDYDNSVGLALQAGVDIQIKDKWFANIDVKKVWINSEVTINGAVAADVDINPWLIGFGIGYRF